ncbi:GNAT family N-acetyltransferase [Ornithinibacillus halophilus]|uniref:Predicted N-acyltransferase, GNAT family n=1 Tax=Ornithinibacillus halophilus TaxID=930117 RepID=A0A1M5IRM3_9BACI|nr:GNAT family N-acetyltransferase [Ornithinibacillus halophilus]SHG30423.1 Predicted N-acyltransferase, GNAT family [Ornithinibacillus halophilus]
MRIIITKNTQEKNDAFSVRTTVFVEEQNVSPEEELDEHDATAIHFVGYEDNQPIAASRLRFVDEYGKLERICVLKEYRGKHFGQQIIEEMEKVIKEEGFKKSKLNAQTHAEAFYQKLGYETVSEEFMDAGIPHVTMVKSL